MMARRYMYWLTHSIGVWSIFRDSDGSLSFIIIALVLLMLILRLNFADFLVPFA